MGIILCAGNSRRIIEHHGDRQIGIDVLARDAAIARLLGKTVEPGLHVVPVERRQILVLQRVDLRQHGRIKHG